MTKYYIYFRNFLDKLLIVHDFVVLDLLYENSVFERLKFVIGFEVPGSLGQ